MYTAQVGSYEFPVIGGSAEWKQNEIGKFDFYVPRYLVGNADLYLEPVVVYRDGTAILQGIVLDYTKTKQQGKTLLTELNCLESMGELMLNYYGKAASHYQDVQLTVLLADLLSITGGTWQLGSFSSMPDTGIATTIDARDKETLWAQLLEAVKKTPGNFLRYGGQNLGIKKVDVGSFDTVVGVIAEDILLEPMKFKRRANMPIQTMRGFGGKSGSRIITLKDALDADPSLGADPDFPISSDSQGEYVITNTAIVKGRSVTKHFNSIKTKNDSAPTTTEIQEAGLALYQATVREIKKNQSSLTVQAKCAMEIPQVPSAWRVIGNATESVYDGVEGHVRDVPTLELNQQMTLIKADLEFADAGLYLDGLPQEAIIYEALDLELTDSGYVIEDDEDMLLAEKTERYGEQDSPGSLLNFSNTGSVVVNQTGVAPNCVNSNGAAARQFIFPMPTPPANAKSVYVTITANATCLIDITTAPRLSPVTNAVACVTGPNGVAWNVGTNITCTATYYFVV